MNEQLQDILQNQTSSPDDLFTGYSLGIDDNPFHQNIVLFSTLPLQGVQ